MVARALELAQGAQALGGDGSQGGVLGIDAEQGHAVGDGLFVMSFAEGDGGAKAREGTVVRGQCGQIGMLRADGLELSQGLGLPARGEEESRAKPPDGGVARSGGEGGLAVDDGLGNAA